MHLTTEQKWSANSCDMQDSGQAGGKKAAVGSVIVTAENISGSWYH